MLDHMLGLDEPGCNGWTTSLCSVALDLFIPRDMWVFFFPFPRKQVPSAVVNEVSMGEEPCDERSPRRSVLQSQRPRALKYICPQACACDASIPKRSRNSIYHGRAGDI